MASRTHHAEVAASLSPSTRSTPEPIPSTKRKKPSAFSLNGPFLPSPTAAAALAPQGLRLRTAHEFRSAFAREAPVSSIYPLPELSPKLALPAKILDGCEDEEELGEDDVFAMDCDIVEKIRASQ